MTKQDKPNNAEDQYDPQWNREPQCMDTDAKEQASRRGTAKHAHKLVDGSMLAEGVTLLSILIVVERSYADGA